MAERLFQEVFQNYGLPEDIVLDRGPQFVSQVWRNFMKLLGVTVSLSSGYHPQLNWQPERKIQSLPEDVLPFKPKQLESFFFPWAEYAQNSLRQAATGMTPFQCILG